MPLSGIVATALGDYDTYKATTDSGGRYDLAGLMPGTYTVGFSDPAGHYVAGDYNGTGISVIGQASTVAATAGTTTDVSVALTRGVWITGTVTNGGYPEAQVTVGYCDPFAPKDSTAWPMDCDDAVAHYGLPETSTDASGAFALLAIPGRYALAVRFRGPPLGYYVPGGLVADQTAAAIVDARSADVPGVRIELPAGATGPHVRGKVTGPNGDGVGGIDVQVCVSPYGGCNGFGLTAPDGRFNLALGAGYEGKYYIELQDPKDRFPGGWLGASGFTTNAAARETLAITADVNNLEIRLAQGYHVSGRVIAPDGSPASDVHVELCYQGASYCGEAYSNSKGVWRTQALGAHAYTVTFVDENGPLMPGFLGANDEFTPSADRAVPIDLRGDIRSIVARPPLGVIISGTVTGDDGNPWSGVSVSACGSNRACGASATDSKGGFRVAVAPGRYRIFAEFTGGPDDDRFLNGYVGASGLTHVTRQALLFDATAGGVSGVDVQLTDAPRAAFLAGGQLSGTGPATDVPMVLRWANYGAPKGVYDIDRSIDGRPFRTIARVPDSRSSGTSVRTVVRTGPQYKFSVTETDAPNAFPGQYDDEGPQFRVDLVQDSNASVSYHGAWTVVRSPGASGGNLHVTSAGDASATIRTTGRDFAWIATVGPNEGRAELIVDGRSAGSFDLHGAAVRPRTLVATFHWSTPGDHQVEVKVLSGRVTLDAFAVAR
jgi:hypothetical protein